ncbi:MAG: universal stress protein [Candidatus Nitrosopumilus sp. bin_32a]
MYNTILVPHAGTDAGDKALKHAIYAAKNTSKIIILHIVETLSYPPTYALATSERHSLIKAVDEANEEMKQDMEREMEKYSQQCKENNIDSEIKVEIGDAAEIILNVVEKENVDLIVMAKRRKLKGLKSLLTLGSVSRKIIENTSCPVLMMDAENNS